MIDRDRWLEQRNTEREMLDRIDLQENAPWNTKEQAQPEKSKPVRTESPSNTGKQEEDFNATMSLFNAIRK